MLWILVGSARTQETTRVPVMFRPPMLDSFGAPHTELSMLVFGSACKTGLAPPSIRGPKATVEAQCVQLVVA